MEAFAELAATVRAYFDAAEAGDVSGWAARHISDPAGLRLIGTDRDELFSGEDAVAYLTSGDGHVRDVSVDLRALEAFTHGPAGWAFALPRLVRPGCEPIELRWTATFTRGSGPWQLVQLHVSAGAVAWRS